MENKKVVVALGRNAFSESFPKQQERVKAAAKAIADLVEEKYQIVIMKLLLLTVMDHRLV